MRTRPRSASRRSSGGGSPLTGSIEAHAQVIAHYRDVLRVHGLGPAGVRMSPAGQAFRFAKLTEIGDLRGRRILDLGCGLGHFYAYLRERVGEVDYLGVDLVADTIEAARALHPEATFLCDDVLAAGPADRFDYVILSAVFNEAIGDPSRRLRDMITWAWAHSDIGIAFNFISTRVNSVDHELAYHDPCEVLQWLIDEITPRVSLHHHYERCDVAVFAWH